MKAVVLETKDGYCAVLRDDGTVDKIRMAAEVGQEIDVPDVYEKAAKIRRFPFKMVAAAASVALVAVCSGYLSFIQSYSFVSMDVDASVEYSLNRMDRVVRVSGFDKKGEAIAKRMEEEGIIGSTLDEAVDKTASVLQEEGYVEKPEDVVLVSVASKSERKSEGLKKRVAKSFGKVNLASAVEGMSLDDRKAAEESGLSNPRYAMVNEVVEPEDFDEATIEVAKSKSASELLLMAEDMDESLQVQQDLGEDVVLTAEDVDPEVSYEDSVVVPQIEADSEADMKEDVLLSEEEARDLESSENADAVSSAEIEGFDEDMSGDGIFYETLPEEKEGISPSSVPMN